MKVLLITRDHSGRQSGLSTWSVEIARRLSRRCEDFAVLSLGATGAPARFGSDVEWLGPASGVPRPRRAGAWRAELTQATRRFELVLGDDWLSAAAALAWRGRSSIRRVCAAVHGPELDGGGRHASWPLAPLWRATRALVLVRADALLSASPHARVWLDGQRLEGPRREHVGTGCDPERFRAAPRGLLARDLGLTQRRVLLSVAHLVPERRIDKVLFAVSALGVRYPDLVYVVVGEGPEQRRLERLAERLRIGHRVRFLAALAQPRWPELYNLCDVFVHLCARGSSPDVGRFALLEALACAKPAVVTAGPELEDPPGEPLGLAVADGDSSELAEALTALLERPDLRRELGERGRRHVLTRATWDAVAERVLSALAAADEPRSLGRARRGGGAARGAPELLLAW